MMSKEHSKKMNEDQIDKEIEKIIYNGVRHMNKKKYLSGVKTKIPKDIMINDVMNKIENIIFRGCSKEFKDLFYSEVGCMSMCPKSFLRDDVIYSCQECASDPTCVMCEDCFVKSKHIKHKYNINFSSLEGGLCDCGDEEAWSKDPSCEYHANVDRSKILTNEFSSRYTKVLSRLFTYFSHVSTYEQHDLLKYIKHPKSPKPNTYCLIMLNDESHSYQDVINTMEHALQYSETHSNNLAREIDISGLCSIIEGADLEVLRKKKDILDEFKSGSNNTCLRTKILSDEQYVHMLAVPILMEWIYKFVCRKAELCEILTECLYKHTDLFKVYIKNEIKLWKDYRRGMIYRLVNLSLYCDKGKTYIVRNYLKYFNIIFDNYVSDDHFLSFFFLNLTVQFITCPPLVRYLIENNFFCVLLQAFQQKLLNLGIKDNTEITLIESRNHLLPNKFERIFYISGALSELSFNIFVYNTWSNEIKNNLMQATYKLVDFLIAFDNMEPIKKVTNNIKENDVEFSSLISLVYNIHDIMHNMSKWILCYKDAANNIVHELYLKLHSFFIQLFPHHNQSNNDNHILTCAEQLQQIICYNNIYVDRFSIFNFSVRYFTEILTHLLWKDEIDNNDIKNILDNHYFLIYLTFPAIVSFVFVASYHNNEWRLNTDSLLVMPSFYKRHHFRKYLFQQDFKLMQVLLCNISPKIFIYYLCLNYFPSQRETPNIFSMSQLVEYSTRKYYFYESLLILIFNCLTERFMCTNIKNDKNPEYNYLKREIMHVFASGDLTRNTLVSRKLTFRDLNIADRAIIEMIDNILLEVTFQRNFSRDRIYSLKPELYSCINRFYYHYDISDISKTYQAIVDYCSCSTNKLYYNIYDLYEPNHYYKGLYIFIESDEYLQFLLGLLQGVFANNDDELISIHADLIEIILMSIHLILYTLIHCNNRYNEQKIKNIIGIRAEYGNITLCDFIHHEVFTNFEVCTIKAIAESIIILINDFNKEEYQLNVDKVNKFKELAAKSREETLIQMEENDKKFLSNNTDWILYLKELENCPDMNLEDNTVGADNNKSLDSNNKREQYMTLDDVYCMHCKNDETVELSHLPYEIGSFPSELLYCARLKYTRRLSDRSIKFENQLKYDLSEENRFVPKLNDQYLKSLSDNDIKLSLTGCCHVIHFECICEQSFDSISSEGFSMNSFSTCGLCTSKYNIALPFFVPIYISHSFQIDIHNFITVFLKNIHTYVAPYLLKDITSFLTPPCDKKDKVSIPSKNIQVLNCVNWKYYKIFNSITVNCDSRDICDKTYGSIIASFNCLYNSLKTIEVINRDNNNKPIFTGDVIESTNFKVCAQFARYCFYGCGLTQVYYNRKQHYVDKTIVCFYGQYKFLIDILWCITQNSLTIEYYNQLIGIEPLFFFIKSFFGLVNICHIASIDFDCRDIWSNVFYAMFVMYSVIILSKFNQPFNIPNNAREEEIDNNEIEYIYNFYHSLSKVELKDEIKKDLYLYWLYQILPFVIQCSTLFCQLFYLKPPSLLCQSIKPSSDIYLKEFFKYMGFSSDFFIHVPPNLDVFARFFKDLCTHHRISKNTIIDYKYFTQRISLAPLPELFLDLVLQVRGTKCKTCNNLKERWYKCLICGTWVSSHECPSFTVQKPSEERKMLLHSISCDCLDGLYIGIRPPVIYGHKYDKFNKLDFSIYQDTYGESMLTSKSNLYLSKENYNKLEYLYQRDLIYSIPSIRR